MLDSLTRWHFKFPERSTVIIATGLPVQYGIRVGAANAYEALPI